MRNPQACVKLMAHAKQVEFLKETPPSDGRHACHSSEADALGQFPSPNVQLGDVAI